MNVLKKRQQLKLNQAEFWARVGVTQSGGSRYEGGRRIPKPVQTLIAIAYGTESERGRVLRALCPAVAQ